MRLDERWLWLGEPVSPQEAGLTVFRVYPGCWFLAHGGRQLGPLADGNVLRATRVACTPTIDGCELGPHQLGLTELGPWRPLRRGPRWRDCSPTELPWSITHYDAEALEPVSGCCTTDDSLPRASWDAGIRWQGYLEQPPARGGALRVAWNAHPAGSLLFVQGAELAHGFAVVDLPPG